MHLAWAVGTPVVGLFGPTDPALNAPPGEAHKILYAGPPRRPLYLDRIRPDEVEAAVLEILQRSGAASPGGVPR
jgi:ADP-heptose:LPS heptosyltransferase